MALTHLATHAGIYHIPDYRIGVENVEELPYLCFTFKEYRFAFSYCSFFNGTRSSKQARVTCAWHPHLQLITNRSTHAIVYKYHRNLHIVQQQMNLHFLGSVYRRRTFLEPFFFTSVQETVAVFTPTGCLDDCQGLCSTLLAGI